MPSFTFNKKTRTYFQDGRPVKPETLRAWVAEVMERTRDEMHAVTEDFIGGGVNRAAWAIEMRGLIARSHGAVAMLAQGGRDAMDEKAWGKAGNRIKEEVGLLRNFERDLANDRAGSDAQILDRAGKYANPLWRGYFNALLANERGGDSTVRVARVLEDGAAHCSDCPSLAGVYSIDEAPDIGESACGDSCRCYFVIVNDVEAVQVA